MRKEDKHQNIPAAGWRGGLCLDKMQVQDDVQIVRSGASWERVVFIDVGSTANKIEELANRKS